MEADPFGLYHNTTGWPATKDPKSCNSGDKKVVSGNNDRVPTRGSAPLALSYFLRKKLKKWTSF